MRPRVVMPETSTVRLEAAARARASSFAERPFAMQDMTIQECFPECCRENLEQLLASYLAIWNDPENLRFLSFTAVPFDESTLRSWMSNHVSLGVHYYAASMGDDIRGIAVVRMSQIEGFELTGIGVSPDSKGEGVGTAMIEHVVSVAVDRGFRAVDAFVFADNIKMLRVLLSRSFIPVGMDYHRRHDGADLLRMQRSL